MLHVGKTRYTDTATFSIADGESVQDSGIVMVYDRSMGSVNGETPIRKSKGGEDVLAGITVVRTVPPHYMPMIIEDEVVPASLAFDLGRAPAGGDHILVKVDDVAVNLVSGAPADETQVQLNFDGLVFHADHAGKSLYVQMIYVPDMVEARDWVGDSPIGGLAEPITKVTTLVTGGTVATDYYDAKQDWSDPKLIHPFLGADGRFSPVAVDGGEALKNVVIVEAPSAGSDGFLVVRIRGL